MPPAAPLYYGVEAAPQAGAEEREERLTRRSLTWESVTDRRSSGSFLSAPLVSCIGNSLEIASSAWHAPVPGSRDRENRRGGLIRRALPQPPPPLRRT
ncbi:MAG: hypothetical protein KTV45_15660, partial [Acidimicrobiia bacterium]|nr:hypothetical protein [Acidimicrobiia bacterium]